MAGSDRSIFRESAIERYIQRQEHNILLRMATPPVFVFLWVMLLLFLGAGALAWFVQVPITINGSGVLIIQKGSASTTFSGQARDGMQSVHSLSLISASDISLPGAAAFQPQLAGKPTPTPPRAAKTPTPVPVHTPIVIPTLSPPTPVVPTQAVPTAEPTAVEPTAATPPTQTPVAQPTPAPATQGAGLQPGQKVVVVLFLPPSNQLKQLRQGNPASISIDSLGVKLNGTISYIATSVISPSDARAQYQLDGPLAQVVTGPSVAVKIDITAQQDSAAVYQGSTCQVSIQVGTQSLLSLIPGLDQIFKQ